MTDDRDRYPPGVHLGQYWPDAQLHDEHDVHYMALRWEYQCRLDEEYRAWREQQSGADFEQWRSRQRAPAEAPNVHPTDHRALETRRDGPPSEDTNLFFERS